MVTSDNLHLNFNFCKFTQEKYYIYRTEDIQKKILRASVVHSDVTLAVRKFLFVPSAGRDETR